MAEPDRIVTAADLEKMSPQERADVVGAAVATDWSEVPDAFRAQVNATARRLGEQRRSRG
jgi:hypothetical protein